MLIGTTFYHVITLTAIGSFSCLFTYLTFTADLDWTEHHKIINGRAYQMLGLIRHTFRIDCAEAMKQLYIALVRSQMLYCFQLWRPQLIIKDINMLERVQRLAMKYMLSDCTSSYKSRLQQLQMLPLMHMNLMT